MKFCRNVADNLEKLMLKFSELFILLSDCNAVPTVKRGSTGAPERLPVLSSNSTLMRYEPARVVQSIKSLHCPASKTHRSKLAALIALSPK